MAHTFDFEGFLSRLAAFEQPEGEEEIARKERLSAIFELASNPPLMGTNEVANMWIEDIKSCLDAVEVLLCTNSLYRQSTSNIQEVVRSDADLFESMISVQLSKDNLRHMRMKRTTVSKTFF